MSIPKVVYNGTTVEFPFYQGLWTPGSRMIGGSDIAPSGVSESFEIRRDSLLHVELNYPETMWPQVRAWLAWAQRTGYTFEFWLDKTDDLTKVIAHLEDPGPGKEIKPKRHDYRPYLSITLTLRVVPQHFTHLPVPWVPGDPDDPGDPDPTICNSTLSSCRVIGDDFCSDANLQELIDRAGIGEYDDRDPNYTNFGWEGIWDDPVMIDVITDDPYNGGHHAVIREWGPENPWSWDTYFASSIPGSLDDAYGRLTFRLSPNFRIHWGYLLPIQMYGSGAYSGLALHFYRDDDTLENLVELRVDDRSHGSTGLNIPLGTIEDTGFADGNVHHVVFRLRKTNHAHFYQAQVWRGNTLGPSMTKIYDGVHRWFIPAVGTPDPADPWAVDDFWAAEGSVSADELSETMRFTMLEWEVLPGGECNYGLDNSPTPDVPSVLGGPFDIEPVVSPSEHPCDIELPDWLSYNAFGVMCGDGSLYTGGAAVVVNGPRSVSAANTGLVTGLITLKRGARYRVRATLEVERGQCSMGMISYPAQGINYSLPLTGNRSVENVGPGVHEIDGTFYTAISGLPSGVMPAVYFTLNAGGLFAGDNLGHFSGFYVEEIP